MDDLDKRIEAARKNNEERIPSLDQKIPEDEEPEEVSKGARAGSEFLASVFAGAIIGFGVDWLFSSTA